MSAADVVPIDTDLPGTGWLAIDEGFEAPGAGGPGEMLDCVGPDFPDSAVVASVSSPHFVRPPGRLVHGVGVEFDSLGSAVVAAGILGSGVFAECLARSVASDLVAGADSGALDAELLGVEVETTDVGHRARFTGGNEAGVRPVNLDVVVVQIGASVGVLWCGDTPGYFPPDDLTHLVARLRAR